MAKDPLSMSLDDLIKENREQVTSGNRGKSRGRGRGQRSDRPRFAAANNLKVTVTNKINKPRAGRRTAPAAFRTEPTPARSLAALAGDEKWEHDMYKEEPPRVQGRRRGPVETGTTLSITNLDYKVSNDDIQELFETVGPLKRCGIKFDRSGRSEGTAEVIFADREHAVQALKRYNNVALDGKPMQIELVKASTGHMLSSGISVGEAGQGRLVNNAFSKAVSDAQGQARPLGPRGDLHDGAGGGMRSDALAGGMRSDHIGGGYRGGRGSRRGGRGGGSTRAVRTKAELDEEMDTYMQE